MPFWKYILKDMEKAGTDTGFIVSCENGFRFSTKKDCDFNVKPMPVNKKFVKRQIKAFC